jgi:HEPN domain-containing protein
MVSTNSRRISTGGSKLLAAKREAAFNIQQTIEKAIKSINIVKCQTIDLSELLMKKR